MPVDTTIILLRPAADGPDLSGTFEKRDRHGDVYDWFRCNVVRVWQRPVAEVLAAGLPVLPLAPVSAVGPQELPEILAAISERLTRESSPEEAATIWAATKVLMGLRYSKEQVEDFTKGISAMILGIRGIEESTVYQDIFAKGEARGEAKGRVEEAREALLRVGRRKLGEPRQDLRRGSASSTTSNCSTPCSSAFWTYRPGTSCSPPQRHRINSSLRSPSAGRIFRLPPSPCQSTSATSKRVGGPLSCRRCRIRPGRLAGASG